MKLKLWAREVDAFPEYYEQYFKQAMLGGSVAPFVPQVCVGPVRYRGEAAIRRDIDNLKAAVAAAKPYAAFIPATAPSGVGINEYYKTEEEYFHALGAALSVEYRAIVDAGFLLQIDCPDLAMGRHVTFSNDSDEVFLRHAQMQVEALNAALEDIPADRVRMHLCWGNYEGPHHRDIPLDKLFGIVMKARPNTILFEASNPRHAHEWKVFADRRHEIPDSKILVPGVISSTSNYIEHPEIVAERLIRFADIVGRERIMAGSDCGFSTFAGDGPVDPDICYAKLRSLAEGATLASSRLWNHGKGRSP
jgi:5-methyltetrahydropteroyltriglutamate--homocysteine methyltransferase